MPDTTYFSGDHWPVENATVNVVLCTETLEHVLETRRFLGEAARCLAPGGTLLLTIPFAARWHFIPYDYWRFTPSSLNHLLTTTGFHSTRVYARGNACTVACYKVMTLLLLLLMPQNVSKVGDQSQQDKQRQEDQAHQPEQKTENLGDVLGHQKQQKKGHHLIASDGASVAARVDSGAVKAGCRQQMIQTRRRKAPIVIGNKVPPRRKGNS